MNGNVLLTSVGRRSYLVRYFQAALQGRGRVVASNMIADTAGMHAADLAVTTPPAYSDDYVPAILEICRRHDIRLLCSLHDLDVLVLSRHRAAIEALGTVAMLPSPEWGLLALDKLACTRGLQQEGVPVPWTTSDRSAAREALRQGQLRFPLVVKARAGFGSLGLAVCHDEQELDRAWRAADEQVARSVVGRFVDMAEGERVLIQQHLPGREFCVGIANDLQGRYRAHFVCEVHEMRAGESDRATSVDRSLVGELPRRISAITRHPGLWGLDCLDDAGVLRVIDLNPRFSGDYPFHHLAGADVPRALLDWVAGQEPDAACFEARAGVRGYKDLVPTAVPPGR